MESDKDHIRDVFSSRFSNFEPEVPASVWEKIDADLSMLPPNIHEGKHAVRKIFFKTSAWVASIAAILIAIYFILPEDTDNRFGKSNLAQHLGRLDLENLNSEVAPSRTNKTTHSLDTILPGNNFLAKVMPLASSIHLSHLVNDEGVNHEIDGVSIATVAGGKELLFTDNVIREERGDMYTNDATDLDFEKELQSKIAAFEAEGLNLNNVLADNSTSVKSKKQNSGFQLGVEGGSGFSKSGETKKKMNTTFQNGSNVVVMRATKVKMEHNQPLTFGIAINKRINDKLSLESGVTYTYLSSRFKTDKSSDIKQRDMQYFHYLGIPLTINYTFAEWKKIRFYSAVGGMIQKDFYGRIRSDMSVEGLYDSDFSYKKKISQNNAQFSINGGLGLSYPIYDKLGVYTNFGGAYYFDAKNEFETIYSDKKWLFNLNLGLKFEF